MKRNDYIKLLSAGLLHVTEEDFQPLVDFIEQRFEVKELRKVQAVSIGGQTPDRKYLGLIDWALELRKERIQYLTFFYGSFPEKSLPAHIAAAFAGVEDILLHVKTGSGTYFYILHTAYSSGNEMSPSQFAELVDAQHDPASEWKRIEELIQESNALNNRALIAKGTASQHLLDAEGSRTFEWQAGDFVKELQMNALIAGKAFIIPEHLKHLLQQSSFSFGGSDKDYTYLYPVEDLSGAELALLIKAQSFAEEVWQKLKDYGTQYPSEDFPDFSIEQWKNNITTLSGNTLNSLGHIVCRAICECCDEKGVKPLVPEQLKIKLGPDELEAKRIWARGKIEDTQWFLTANTAPWEAHVLELVDYQGDISTGSEPELKKSFLQALTEIADFADKHQSYYAEAFKLAAYCLKENLPEGSFDEAHKNKVIAELQTLSFSERAVENFSNTFYYSEELKLMGWNNADIFAFFACSTADVFGGMGSWNDQYFEPEAENEIYQRLSANLYDALKRYFVTLISFQ